MLTDFFGTLAVYFPQEDTIFSMGLFDNCHAQSDALQILLPQFRGCFLQKISDEFNLRRSYPDIAFTWPGAAPATLLTLEMQTTNIP